MPAVTAEVRSVTRKEVIGNTIAVPGKLAPASDDVLGHVLFALKHGGIDLQVLAQVLPGLPEAEIRAAFDASPNSQYLRKACFLWEHFTGLVIQRRTTDIRQAYVPLFNPAHYITGAGVRNARWRVTFNGLGLSARNSRLLRHRERIALGGQGQSLRQSAPTGP